MGFTVVTGNPEACQSGEQLQQRLAVNNSAKEQQVATQTFVRNTGKVKDRDHPSRREPARWAHSPIAMVKTELHLQGLHAAPADCPGPQRAPRPR